MTSTYKIPVQTYNRNAWRQTTSVEIQKNADCPSCGAKAGYYCVTKKGNKSPVYHQARFAAYIKTPKLIKGL